MFSVSQTTSHAIRALACLAAPRCERPSVATVSACSGVPQPYLAKVIRHLCAAGIVEARRGRAGGVRLARPPDTVRLWDICAAIDGEDCLSGCLLGEALCNGDRGCPTHDFWAAHRAAIRRKLEETTLAQAIRHAGQREARCAGLPSQCTGGRSTRRKP